MADFDRAINGGTYKREVINRAKCNLALKNYQKALNDANLCLSNFPDHITAIELRTRAMMGLGKLKEALADADALIKDKDDNPDLYKMRAEILQKTRSYQGGFRLILLGRPNFVPHMSYL